MPKMKTHTAMEQRIRITGKGKLVADRPGKRHKMEVKASSRARRLSAKLILSKADAKRVKKLLAR
jgi:large subunit ribosomal protein L35